MKTNSPYVTDYAAREALRERYLLWISSVQLALRDRPTPKLADLQPSVFRQKLNRLALKD